MESRLITKGPEKGWTECTNVPEKEEVLRRMLTGLAEPEKIDLKIPADLEYMRADLYEYETRKRPKAGEQWPRLKLNEKYTMPPLWYLRPDAKDGKTTEDYLDEIVKLPNDTEGDFWKYRRKGKWTGKKKLPEYVGVQKPINACYIQGAEQDSVVADNGQIVGSAATEPFEFMGKEIVPDVINGVRCFRIESKNAHFEWTFREMDKPVRSFILNGTFWELIKLEGNLVVDKVVGRSRYPESGVWDNNNHPNWKRPLSFYVDINPSAVYGDEYINLKGLGFFDGLKVATNFVELVEYAYGLGERPKDVAYPGLKIPPLEKQIQNPPRKNVIYQALELIMADGDKTLLTKTGKPRCSALSARVNGKRVSAKERNEAMKRYRQKLLTLQE